MSRKFEELVRRAETSSRTRLGDPTKSILDKLLDHPPFIPIIDQTPPFGIGQPVHIPHALGTTRGYDLASGRIVYLVSTPLLTDERGGLLHLRCSWSCGVRGDPDTLFYGIERHRRRMRNLVVLQR
jgi:hypothetical protein